MFTAYTAALLTIATDILVIAANKYCSCGHYQRYDWIGPYCAQWFVEGQSFCILSGGSNASTCPGAVQIGNESLYWTEDNEICERSQNYTLQNCKCKYYPEYHWVGPYCLRWIKDEPPFCFLAGRADSKYCPDAEQLGDENLYWTENEEVCNKSILPSTDKIRLSIRQPFTVIEITTSCMYVLTIVIGTFGNVLVVKYFAQGEASARPGSKFVVVLAVIDFVSSLWMPGIAIVGDILYKFPFFYHWPFGESACYIFHFHGFLIYSTPWLLLAISMERARAVYKPFADRLSARFVLLISTVILLGSCALNMKAGISFKYETGKLFYIEGATYEYTTCYINLSKKEYLIETLVTFSIGIWFPMLLILIVYILMYIKLKKQAVIRRNSSSQNSNAQMTQISRTFSIVLIVFYICYLPSTMLFPYLIQSINTEDYDTVRAVFSVLLFTNSCLNPIIYSKIHEKIYKNMKQLIGVCGGQCACAVEYDCCNRRQSTPPRSSPDDISNQRENHQNRYNDHMESYYGPEIEFGTPHALSGQSCEHEEVNIDNISDQYEQENSRTDDVQETAL